nr:FAD-dependent oxidoreductase [uncultured Rhodopila sp.]
MRVVIVGAGVLGASAAFHLAKAGADVTIVDAHLDGRATAAGAGIICPWLNGAEDMNFYRLYAGGAEYYPDLLNALAAAGAGDTGYRQPGAMLVSAEAAELDWTEHFSARRQADSPSMGVVERLTPQQARARFPPLRADLGAVFVGGGARVDGRRLAAALLTAAQHHGATVVQGHAAVVTRSGRAVGARVGNEIFPADTVVVTAGAWAAEVLRPLGADLSVLPQRGQIVHLDLEGVDTSRWPVILPPGEHYIVPFDNGRLVCGATRETGSGFDYRVTAAGQAEVLAEGLRIAPGLGVATMVETRIGFRPMGAGLRPVLGWVPGVEALAVGNGLGAAGLTIGPLAGRMLADLVLGQPAFLDLAPFDPGRRGVVHTGVAEVLR